MIAITSERPLISFCLFAYNQERFIREAVEGAFAQTYSPLEIILSDDCSPDHTYEIMQEMAAAYRGPHKLILNRNSRNLGLGGHVNRVMELSAGPLVVGAAGDDVSHPERAGCLCEEWLRQDPMPTSLHSDFELMDAQGTCISTNRAGSRFAGRRSAGMKEIREFLRDKHPASGIAGCAHAWSRLLFQRFGPLNSDLIAEDKALAFRSFLCGSFAYVPRRLLRYRMHASNLWGRRADLQDSRITRVRQNLAQAAFGSRLWISVLNNYNADVRTLVNQSSLSQAGGVAITREIDRCLKVKTCEYQACSGPPWVAFRSLLRRFVLMPECRYARVALKHWLFRTTDYFGLLPKH